MKFKDLPIGHSFNFTKASLTGFPNGVWVKDSARKYHGHTLNCRVGAINVEVDDLGAFKLYRLWSVNEDDGRRVEMAAYADTHEHVCTLKSKLTDYPHRHLVIEEA